MEKLLLLLIFVIDVVHPQNRILITPGNDVIPIETGRSTLQIVKQHKLKDGIYPPSCTNPFTFGYQPEKFPVEYRFFSAFHRDVVAMWFIAPASGTIDSLFFLIPKYELTFSPTIDSTVFIRIHKSNIGPGRGPGYDYPPPCTPWGYFINTNDLDQGLGAFLEEATDTSWISSIALPYVSFPPMGSELWGVGGYPIHIPVFTDRDTIVAVDLNDLGYKPTVNAGDVFWISIRKAGPHPIDWTEGNYIMVTLFRKNAPLPGRIWKFYEHTIAGNIGSPCAGRDTLGPGWVARGGGLNDPSSSAAFNWLYSITISSDIAPTVLSFESLIHKLYPGPFSITAEIQDCNPPNPTNAGVAWVGTAYNINNTNWDTVSISYVGGDTWSGFIPSTSPGSVIQYCIVARDVNGNASPADCLSFDVVPRYTRYYTVDTAESFEWIEINTSGTRLTEWYIPNEILPIDSSDVGTSGPIDLGGGFRFFDSTFYYAWIGVDGALTLSGSPIDTIHSWRTAERCVIEKIPSTCFPRNFVSPFLRNLVVLPKISTGQGSGAIYYKLEGTKFIIEWDNVASYDTPEDTTITFQVVLDRIDNSITFLYNDVGRSGLDQTAIASIQANPMEKYFFVNADGQPIEWKPQNGRGIRFTPNFSQVSDDGWNLVSSPVTMPDPRVSKVFPTVSSRAYVYQGGYVAKDTIQNGEGYWLKFSGNELLPFAGTERLLDTFSVIKGWNLIGSITKPVGVGAVIPIPDTITQSSYYGYNRTYIEREGKRFARSRFIGMLTAFPYSIT